MPEPRMVVCCVDQFVTSTFVESSWS
jgi:hypothetical protein